MYRPSTVRELLRRHGIRPSRAFGQNFLIDRNILENILAAAALGADELAVEIGPGIGTLTRELCRQAREVMAVEKDRHMLSLLAETLAGCDNLEIIRDDALRFDFERAIERHAGSPVLVSNLPYNVATPILIRMLYQVPSIGRMVLMVQRELGERYAAPPGSQHYGATSLKVQLKSRVQRLFAVPRTVFLPAPAVDSVVIRVTRLPEPLVDLDDEAAFLALVEEAFGQRRKTMLASLSARLAKQSGRSLAENRGLVERALRAPGNDPAARPETLG
ncbi:MAG: 16S rRNA (adenine(1518)-N(6)/adenine(1519)-N(6))-dimethyltransferase RsmA, partial [Candidatus Geothermincolia bacterium]